MKTLHFHIVIQAPRQLVWETMLAPDTYQKWTACFCEGSYYEGSWDKGSSILFRSPDCEGMKALIAENRPMEHLSIQHLSCLTEQGEEVITEPTFENYTLRDHPDGTELLVDMDGTAEYEEFFNEVWPQALQLLKTICEGSCSPDTTMTTHTIHLHRVFQSTPERVYRAFIDPAAMCKWLPPNGFTGTIHHLKATVGGSFKMSFTNFTTQKSMSFGGEYLELIPNEKLRYTDRFDDPNLPGVITVTVLLKAVSCGTDVDITQEGMPGVIPAEACYLGWQESLVLLAKLVEAEVHE